MIVNVFLIDPSGTRLFDATICEKQFGDVAEQAGIDRHLWEPDAMKLTTAKQMIEPLADAQSQLRYMSTPASSDLANWVGKYLAACTTHKDAQIVVTRALDADEKAAMKKAEEDAKAGKV